MNANESRRRIAAVADFRRARRRAALHEIMGRMQGKSVELLSYDEIAHTLRVAGQADRGLQEIGVEQIVGSVGRYQDFDKAFLPRRDDDQQRWTDLLAAAPDLSLLPPIDVYQVGDAYFVIDGNHRVSLARHQGVAFITAHVTEVRTRAPLPEELDPLHLIIAAEQAAFLEQTELDRLRPEAVLAVSLPGSYDKLENHIEVHRFFIEMAEERELADSEAVTRWFDEAYVPVVEAVREQGLLRGFPERTESDLYLWIADNQARLRNELGWEVSAQTAVAQLPDPDDLSQRSVLARLYERVRRNVQTTTDLSPRAGLPWSAQKTLDRYSETLFGDLLVLLAGDQFATALALATRVAHVEEATVHGLLLLPEGQESASAAQQFNHYLRDAGLHGRLRAVSGDWLPQIQRRAPLADLVVLCKAVAAVDPALPRQLLAGSVRPLLFAAGLAHPVRRVLLLWDGRAPAHEALFVAAYMAEAWGAALVLLCPPDAGTEQLGEARRYLAMHECEIAAQVEGPLTPQEAQETAVVHHCDLILCAAYEDGPLSRQVLGDWLAGHWEALERPLLICP